MICPKVPDEQINPAASLGSYPARSMTGKLIKPIVTTVAPTIPVDAANNVPTNKTEAPRPPRILPNIRPIASSKSPARLERSSITPMKIKRGTATSVSAFITPNIRKG